jgi:hypothetical protein
MDSVADMLRAEGARLLEEVEKLLGEDAPMRDINTPDSSVVFIGPPYAFSDPSIDEKRLQARLGDDRRHFFALIRAVLRDQPDGVLKQVDESETTIRDVIEQENLVWHSTTGQACEAARGAVAEVLEAVTHLYDPAEGSVVLVPDTNALIESPSFPDWAFDDVPMFEVLLVPLLLSELDGLKTGHRLPHVREKAQAVIRQIKEYARRGSLVDGVIVVRDRISLRTLAVEPRVNETLPWLDPTAPDDRMLASTIEVMRLHPRSIVAIVTADINLQNKAAFARVPFLEPPSSEAPA